MNVKATYVNHIENPYKDGDKFRIGSDNYAFQCPTGKKRDLPSDTSRIFVDKIISAEQYQKTVLNYISSIFNLTKTGQRALYILSWAITNQNINNDEVILDKETLRRYLAEYPAKKWGFSELSFKSGLNDLENNHIIARTNRNNIYFYNRNILHNADTQIFTITLEKLHQDGIQTSLAFYDEE